MDVTILSLVLKCSVTLKEHFNIGVMFCEWSSFKLRAYIWNGDKEREMWHTLVKSKLLFQILLRSWTCEPDFKRNRAIKQYIKGEKR